MGGQQAVSRHRASGRLPVRERVALLFDEGSWYQTGVLAQPEDHERDGRQVGAGTACSWYCSRPTAKGHVRRPGGRTSRPGP